MRYHISLTGFVLLVVIASGACTRLFQKQADRKPGDVVKQFLDLSASATGPDDKKKLQDLCSGEMRRAFERMTDEAFRLSYLAQDVRIKEFKVLSESLENGVARLHYQVMIENLAGTDPTTETSEREVELTESRGAWYLESIRPMGSDQIAFTRGMIF